MAPATSLGRGQDARGASQLAASSGLVEDVQMIGRLEFDSAGREIDLASGEERSKAQTRYRGLSSILWHPKTVSLARRTTHGLTIAGACPLVGACGPP